MKPKNHTERMIDKYNNMAKKATSPEVRDECLKRAQMLRTMNYNRMIGENDIEHHRRSIKYMQAEERGDDMTLAIEKINREFGR